MTKDELRSMMQGYIQDATQSDVPKITLLNRMIDDIELYKIKDNTQAFHDEACCDDDNRCDCGMKGKSLYSKKTTSYSEIQKGPYWEKVGKLNN